VAGSGWVAAPRIVVTNAHVVAGQRDTTVTAPGSRPLLAETLVFDVRNDIAILRVRGLRAGPLTPAQPGQGNVAAIVGYPHNGPLRITPARTGRTAVVLSEDAYGAGPVPREITSVGGDVVPGNSGGPVLDAEGRVVGTIFASRTEGGAGYAVPPDIVGNDLRRATRVVSTGDCVR
jgi:S1-C subfamily serine protease